MTAASAELRVIDDTLTDVLAKLAAVNARLAELTAEAEELKEQCRALAAGDWTDATGRPVLRLTPSRKFDHTAGLALVPEERRKECLTVVVDPVKVKSHLTPVQLDECMVESGKTKVVVL